MTVCCKFTQLGLYIRAIGQHLTYKLLWKQKGWTFPETHLHAYLFIFIRYY